MDTNIVKHFVLGKTGERLVFSVILLNSIIIYLQVSGFETPLLDVLDFLCIGFFIVEMLVKIYLLGFKSYWSDGWNKMDFILVLISIPSLTTLFVDLQFVDLSVLLSLRLLRALRFFRMVRFFGNSVTLMAKGFARAMKASSSVLAAFFIIIVVFGLINCSLFGQKSPEYFETPLRSIYSVFRFFTIEGWYDIPDSIISGSSSTWQSIAIRFYFCMLLIGGGIIGMSFINSVFVDAMVEDNNDEVLEEIKKLQEHQKRIEDAIAQLNAKLDRKGID